jgi:glutaredoxin
MGLLSIIEHNQVVVLSKKNCSDCEKLRKLLNSKCIEFKYVVIDEILKTNVDEDVIFGDIENLKKKWEIHSYPMMFIKEIYIGNYKTILEKNVFNEFNNILKNANIYFEEESF